MTDTQRKQSQEIHIAMLFSRDASFVIMLWAIWLAGGTAVFIPTTYPAEHTRYILLNSNVSLLIVSNHLQTHSASADLMNTTNIETLRYTLSRPNTQSNLEKLLARWKNMVNECPELGAYIVYTSGTSGKPKGVVITHRALSVQVQDIVSSWQLSESDHALHFLPLHHVHGLLNNMLCIFFAGGSIDIMPSSKPELIWQRLGSNYILRHTRHVSILMAVPTIYFNLLEEAEKWTEQSCSQRNINHAIEGARAMRLSICGSASCPLYLMKKWKALTGLTMLERYGMTELGMVLTNPLYSERHFGYVGEPFPSVQVRLVDPETEELIDMKSGREGELRVKGPTIFAKYQNNEEATLSAFDQDKWFKTGDMMVYNTTLNSFRVLGRINTDILKSGGYKISALDVERAIYEDIRIKECAVFGAPDLKWGHIISAAIVIDESCNKSDLQVELVDFLKERIPKYQVPRCFYFPECLPKNAMGKVDKKLLIQGCT